MYMYLFFWMQFSIRHSYNAHETEPITNGRLCVLEPVHIHENYIYMTTAMVADIYCFGDLVYSSLYMHRIVPVFIFCRAMYPFLYRCTSLYGVPTMFIDMLNHPHVDRYDYSSLYTGVMAGSPCPEETMRQVMQTLHMDQVTVGLHGACSLPSVHIQQTAWGMQLSKLSYATD